MAVLHDTLAEFAAMFCLGRAEMTTLSGLISSLRKKPSTDQLAEQLLEGADKATGWLAMFTSYRNLFTHRAPMEQAAGIAFAVQDMRVLSADLSIPQIYYPLPPNVGELTRRRSSGPLFVTLSELIDASSKRKPERNSEPDALEYLHNCFDQMAHLASVLATRSPIDAKPVHFGSEDIIGEIRVSRE